MRSLLVFSSTSNGGSYKGSDWPLLIVYDRKGVGKGSVKRVALDIRGSG